MHDWQAREWLWVTGYREQEAPGDPSWGNPAGHRQTASWWRLVGSTEWQAIPGRPLGNGPEQQPYPDAVPPSRAPSRKDGHTYTDQNGEGLPTANIEDDANSLFFDTTGRLEGQSS